MLLSPLWRADPFSIISYASPLHLSISHTYLLHTLPRCLSCPPTYSSSVCLSLALCVHVCVCVPDPVFICFPLSHSRCLPILDPSFEQSPCPPRALLVFSPSLSLRVRCSRSISFGKKASKREHGRSDGINLSPVSQGILAPCPQRRQGQQNAEERDRRKAHAKGMRLGGRASNGIQR